MVKGFHNKRARTQGLVVGLCIFLAAITWVVFGQTLRHDFLNYDDNRYVYENPEVTRGLTIHGIVWAFTNRHANNWHPLTSISHMLDCQLFGLNPGGHHFVNVFLHTVAVILLFLVLRAMTGSIWRSAFVAAVFAVHPLRVESVAWISERKDVLSAVFFMLTLGAYARYARQPSLGRYVAMSILFALGLMSKPMLVTVPFVLLLLDYWPLGRFAGRGTNRRLIFEKIPLLLLSIALCTVTLWAQTRGMVGVEKLPLVLRVNNALVTCVIYLQQMIWPVRLAVFYPHPEDSLQLWEVALAVGVLAIITTGAIALRHRFAYLITGWFWYLVMLAPVIGIIQVGSQAHADRYTYLPHIGLYLAVTWAASDALAFRPHRKRILDALAVLAIATLSWRAWIQTSYWRNSESLWLHTLAVTSENPVAHNSFGILLLRQDRVNEAIDQFQRALNIDPTYGDAHNNLSVALTRKGLPDEAIAHLRMFLTSYPEEAKAHYNLGNALLQKGELNDAIAAYEKALSIQSNYAEARYNLGIAFQQSGRIDEAIAQYQKALQDKPDYAEAYYMLGNNLLVKGRIDEAIESYQQALRIRADYPQVQNNIGLALMQKGRPSEAIAHWEKTLQIRSDFVDALNNLGWVLATYPEASIRNGARAVALAERAYQLSGDKKPAILRTLAAAYAESGRFTEAMDIAQRGLELAKTQGNSVLASIFEGDIALYQANAPVRTAPQPGNYPSP